MSIRWGTNPEQMIANAKKRARRAVILKEKNPKLTALEKAFYVVYLEKMEQ